MFRKLKEMDKNTLVEKVESELLDQIKVVRLDSTEVIKGAVIEVIDITVLEDGPDSVGMVADEVKLAVVFTYFFFLFSFPTSSAFHPLRARPAFGRGAWTNP